LGAFRIKTFGSTLKRGRKDGGFTSFGSSAFPSSLASPPSTADEESSLVGAAYKSYTIITGRITLANIRITQLSVI
jgi:hypothetical protein